MKWNWRGNVIGSQVSRKPTIYWGIKIWRGENTKLSESCVRTFQEDRGRKLCDTSHLSLHNDIRITHPDYMHTTEDPFGGGVRKIIGTSGRTHKRKHTVIRGLTEARCESVERQRPYQHPLTRTLWMSPASTPQLPVSTLQHIQVV
jgi:hypothetical protein